MSRMCLCNSKGELWIPGQTGSRLTLHAGTGAPAVSNKPVADASKREWWGHLVREDTTPFQRDFHPDFLSKVRRLLVKTDQALARCQAQNKPAFRVSVVMATSHVTPFDVGPCTSFPAFGLVNADGFLVDGRDFAALYQVRPLYGVTPDRRAVALGINLRTYSGSCVDTNHHHPSNRDSATTSRFPTNMPECTPWQPFAPYRTSCSCPAGTQCCCGMPKRLSPYLLPTRGSRPFAKGPDCSGHSGA